MSGESISRHAGRKAIMNALTVNNFSFDAKESNSNASFNMSQNSKAKPQRGMS
ncbi:hypothetical protein KIN20_006218 [Parelaphostrongylus tenuis]|uniref:Uncharacterized protein n=1 Tax=Parelaphostrongylus tenuis TaxID=148309 RepID=A0AAD5M1F7_PARTN|nr:hypothetical protein KIN20_006218 [Parelaphostrongylus tenuis]